MDNVGSQPDGGSPSFLNKETFAPTPLPGAGTPPAPALDLASRFLAFTRENNESLVSLRQSLDTLRRDLEESNRISREREASIAKLHEENQALRKGEHFQLRLPLFRDIIRLHDDLLDAALHASAANPGSPSSQTLADFATAIEDLLFRHGVDCLRPALGEPVNLDQHQIMDTRATSTPETDRTLAGIMRPGFALDGRMIRPVHVQVHKFIPLEAGDGLPLRP